MAAQHLKQVRP